MPIITLTSDIGLHDYLIGAVKGTLLKANKDFKLIDITHLLSPFNYPQAAYICRNAIRNFPEGSYHIVLVNLFDHKPSHLLMAHHNGHYICCADNGLLNMILEEPPEIVVKVPVEKVQNRNTLLLIETMAEAINKIEDGDPIDAVGTISEDYVVKNPLKPLLGTDWMEGQILFIDNFENVVVNITKEEFEQQRRGRKFSIVFKRDEKIDKISESYADVQEGEKLAMFNSAGYLEIAMNKGNAAGLFGLQGFNEHQSNPKLSAYNSHTFYQTVKVHFLN